MARLKRHVRANQAEASQYQRAFGTWIDWQYQTTSQNSADGKPQTMRSGRALGGSTAINGMAWSKPHTFQIDALEQLGNSGLNWNSLQQYVSGTHDVTEHYQPGVEEWERSVQCRG